MFLQNTVFQTYPLVVHANGTHNFKPHWKPIKETFFALPAQHIGPIQDMTIITFNNGHEAMGMLERCLEHLGVPYLVYGQGIDNWVNSRHKPELTKQAADECTTTYMMGLDSRDVLVLDDPHLLLQRFKTH
ncbi:MAG: hypothetical protein LC660_08435, partial [Desulfobacteraceae bacterium]|nr:hypothetical protein [Desulfobacteraceae bacterium]